ncbi:unnamed protein product [Cochlearia groenlandica]
MIVVWDINNCPIPDDVDAGLVGPIIQSALRKLGYNGPLTIKAIGNLNLIRKKTLRELSTSGIALRNAKNRVVSVIVDMGRWRHENPGNVSIMLISNASSVSVLSTSIADKKANTLLAYPITPSRLNPRLELAFCPVALA